LPQDWRRSSLSRRIDRETFSNPHGDPDPKKLELARSTDEEKQSQLKRLAEFHARNAKAAPAEIGASDTTVGLGNREYHRTMPIRVECYAGYRARTA
jgi:methylmalonyl-CoA mutase